MHRLLRYSLATAVAIAAFGCANADDSDGSVSRDSAGVQIIENPAPRWTPDQQLTLSSTPALVIGTQDGLAYQLSQVRGAFRLTDGRIVIADGPSKQLRFYDSTGLHLHSGGRPSTCRSSFIRHRFALALFSALNCVTMA